MRTPKILIWTGFFCGFVFFLASFLQLIRKMEHQQDSPLTGSIVLLLCGLGLMLIAYLQLRRLSNEKNTDHK